VEIRLYRLTEFQTKGINISLWLILLDKLAFGNLQLNMTYIYDFYFFLENLFITTT